MEELKAWIGWIVMAAGLAFNFGYSKRRVDENEKDIGEIKQLIATHTHLESGYLTLPDLDRAQSTCRQDLYKEIGHIRDGIADIRADLKELKTDIKDVRRQQ